MTDSENSQRSSRQHDEYLLDPSRSPGDHDLLSFASLFLRRYNGLSVGLTLLGVLLDERGPDLRIVSTAGNFFNVATIDSSDLLQHRFLPLAYSDRDPTIPKIVALKIPIITDNLDSPKSKKLWTSMAKEMEILKNDHLSKHKNIVDMLGICWTSTNGPEGSIMPVLVLEGAELGDMVTFLKRQGEIHPQKLLGLGLDIAEGVKAIHQLGIIHGDIKPRNILIFKDDQFGQVAKIGDFGSAIILEEVRGQVNLTEGTPSWQAPECDNAINKEDLPQVDFYSLGLTLANLLSRNKVYEIFESAAANNPENLRFEDHFAFSLAMLVKGSFQIPLDDCRDRNSQNDTEEFNWTQVSDIGEGDIIEIDLFFMIFCSLQNPDLRIDTTEIIKILRRNLHKVLDKRLMDNPGDLWKMNPQEEDVWLRPNPAEVSEEDEQRILQFALSKLAVEIIQQAASQDKTVEGGIARMQGILERFQQQEELAPAILTRLPNPKAVVEVDRCFGTFRMLPLPVIEQFERQLAHIACDTDEDLSRRQRAGFQCGFLVISRLQLHSEVGCRITRGLDMLQLSANLGDKEARGIVGWLNRALQRYLPERVEKETQISWLEEAALDGSSTAMRHLHNIDPELCEKAIQKFRDTGTGIGAKFAGLPSFWFTFDDSGFLAAIKNISEKNEILHFLQCFSVKGSVHLMKELINLTVDSNVNMTNAWGESPLFWACRCGQTEMVQFLLSEGADPSQSTTEGLTPLHFLSAFRETDISDVAKLLLEHGAPLEARATSEASIYHFLVDSPYGRTGTPLLWAVAANNIAATRTLVDLGADPFDRCSIDVPVDNSWSGIIHTSPIMHAASKHQWQLLEVLLPQTPDDPDTTAWALNRNLRALGPLGFIDATTPLDCCIRYSAEGLLWRLLLHGADHEVAFKKTFELLVDRGCNPLENSSSERSTIQNGVEFGQPFAVRHLMEWKDGFLKPSPKDWLILVVVSIRFSDKVMFRTLMEYEQIEGVPKTMWEKFFGNCTETADVEFLDPFKQCLDPNFDYIGYLEKAFMLGNFQTAKWFHKFSFCSLGQFQPSRQRTLLGDLLLKSKYSTRYWNGVKAFFELSIDPEEVFDQVSFIESPDEGFTALHLASYFPEYRGDAGMATKVIETVLEVYHEPKHLNRQIESGIFKGYTALHLAVTSCNVGAVRELLNETDIDISLLTSKGNSVMDLALMNYGNQTTIMQFWDVPDEVLEAEDLKHWMKAHEVLALLQDKDVPPHKLLYAVARAEVEDIWCIPAKKDDPFVKLPYTQKPLPQYMHDNFFCVAISELKLGDCFYISNLDYQAPDQASLQILETIRRHS
ncbi:hypothetical protein TWF694_007284 [Orbilia ellipsospora]|uniref:Protein kinase domain-containing protein n=1 Tax=Orbilia ellipsospora TaxID=2528407 RepID=A0AAV9XH97_9PEZI